MTLLLPVQIHQEQEALEIGLYSEEYDAGIDFYESIVGEEAAKALATATYEPSALTNREKMVLFHLYVAEFVKALRSEGHLETGEEVSLLTAANWAHGLLSNPYGRAWYEAMRDDLFRFAPRHRDAIDTYLAQQGSRVARLEDQIAKIDGLLASTQPAGEM